MVVHLLPVPTTLFKTPTANLGRNGAAQHPQKRKDGGHGPTLDDEVSYLLPLPTLEEAELVQDWVEYEPAIRRHEAVVGRPAPIPTEIGPRGGRRLTARFAEWLMAIPDGWVTDVPDLVDPGKDPRAEQLHKIGNGGAPPQAYEAWRRLMAHKALTEEN
ncbi:DNA (cytosine-5-)-methyltransferase [Streptomyces sp. or20]|uniref:DNA (cytosine-5-)-methyltransferase n=1 Tax=Streptomyces sp. or20 TaxID=1828016 RepID=UPI000BEF9BC9|nr:DNA (cytosine-5-)-methyltransferase [Streptomyces sp. or20]